MTIHDEIPVGRKVRGNTSTRSGVLELPVVVFISLFLRPPPFRKSSNTPEAGGSDPVIAVQKSHPEE